MSNKKEKKITNKKEAKNNTVSMLKLDNDVKIPAMAIFMKDTKYFNINDIDINKIRGSEAKIFMKANKSYKHYIFYEDGDKHIPLNICFSNTLAGYYYEYTNEDGKYAGNVSKKMHFMISDDLVDKINDIFKHIEEKLNIGLKEWFNKSEFNYLKTKV